MSETSTVDLTEFSITEKVAGIDREFTFLNTMDKGEFVRTYRKAKKDALLANMKTVAEITGKPLDQEQVMNTLQDFDEDFERPKWTKYLSDTDGESLTLRLSLRKKYPTDVDRILAALDWEQETVDRIVLQVWGRFVNPGKVQDTTDGAKTTDMSTYGEGGTDPNAGKPEPTTYATPAA